MKWNQSWSFLCSLSYFCAGSVYRRLSRHTHSRKIAQYNRLPVLPPISPPSLPVGLSDLSACGFVCFVFFLKISIKIMYTQRAQHVPFAACTYIYLYNSNGGNSWPKVQFFPPIIFPGINTCNAMRRGDRCFFPKWERDKQKQRQPNALCARRLRSFINRNYAAQRSIYLFG